MPGETVTSLLLKLLAVGALVLLNGFFVAAEFALVKVRETQLAPLIAKGHRRARIAKRVVKNLDASLSACQLGITLASLVITKPNDGASYFFSFSIPLVAPLPGFVAQQKAESSPHALQLCLSSVCAPF